MSEHENASQSLPAPIVVPIDVPLAVPDDAWAGVTIPSRDSGIIRRFKQMRRDCPHLQPADRHAMVRLAALYRLIEGMGRSIHRQTFKQNGDPRKAVDTWLRACDRAQRLEADLGITARSRAAMGLDVVRGLDYARALGGGE